MFTVATKRSVMFRVRVNHLEAWRCRAERRYQRCRASSPTEVLFKIVADQLDAWYGDSRVTNVSNIFPFGNWRVARQLKRDTDALAYLSIVHICCCLHLIIPSFICPGKPSAILHFGSSFFEFSIALSVPLLFEFLYLPLAGGAGSDTSMFADHLNHTRANPLLLMSNFIRKYDPYPDWRRFAVMPMKSNNASVWDKWHGSNCGTLMGS